MIVLVQCWLICGGVVLVGNPVTCGWCGGGGCGRSAWREEHVCTHVMREAGSVSLP